MSLRDESKEYGLLMFKKINVPVINDAGSIMLYEKGCSIGSVKSHEVVSDFRVYTNDELGYICNRYGAKKITFYDKEKRRYSEEAPPFKTNEYRNGKLNCLILKYRRSGDITYLKQIGKQQFLIPVQFIHQTNRYPKIKYAYATLKSNSKEKSHVIFSDFEEFKLWENKIKPKFKYNVILVDSNKLQHINKVYNLCINPCGNRLYIEKDKRKIFYESTK